MDSHLLSLYATVLVPILSEWITGEDVCYLDSAVCSQHRKYLLRLMTQCIVYADVSYTEKVIKNFKSWLLLRGLRVKTYNTKWNLLLESNLISDRLAILDCHNGKAMLDLFQQRSIQADIVHFVCLSDHETLVVMGHKITDLRVVYTNAPHAKIALSCPNLRNIRLGMESDALPYIYHCHNLDTVYNCQLKSLLLRNHIYQSFHCHLKRTSVIDESAVCLGEGKYFNLTGLHTFQVKEEDTLLLVPMVKHLRSLNLVEDRPLLRTVIDKRVNLTSIAIHNVHLHLSDYCTLLQQSPSLTALTLSTALKFVEPIESRVDALLEAAANFCPLLTTVVLYDVSMLESSLMSFLQKTNLAKLEMHNSYRFNSELVVTINGRNGKKMFKIGAEADMQWITVVKDHYEFGK